MAFQVSAGQLPPQGNYPTSVQKRDGTWGTRCLPRQQLATIGGHQNLYPRNGKSGRCRGPAEAAMATCVF